VTEASIARDAAARQFPIIPCTLCGSQSNMQRLVVLPNPRFS
jgi:tRNA 2-thiocytidine biosynthesis protein TtcA